MISALSLALASLIAFLITLRAILPLPWALGLIGRRAGPTVVWI
jgi:hypothetical protein